jgi:hypothetical protein
MRVIKKQKVTTSINKGKKMKKRMLVLIVLSVLCYPIIYLGQTKEVEDSENLFSENSAVVYVSRPGMQFSQIQNQISGMIGISNGVYIHPSFYAGFSAYANLTHTKVNSGIFGLEIEHTFNPHKLVHFGYNIFAGVGTVKDYHQKNNLFDNFLNIFGTNYFFVQPGLLVELNFNSSTRITFNIGYRFAGGLDENHADISLNKLKNRDLNNLTFSINLKTFSF